MPDPITIVMVPSMVIAGVGLINASIGISNSMNRITRFFYVKMWLREEYIRISRARDPLGYTQLAFALNKVISEKQISGCRQIVHMKSGAVDVRLVLPDVSCFVDIKEKNVEIEIENDGFCIWSKAFHPNAADAFVRLLGATVSASDARAIPEPLGLVKAKETPKNDDEVQLI